MHGRGMTYRLQMGLACGDARQDAGFDPGFWARASHLAVFGVELCVTRGAVEVDLLQERPGMEPQLLARLDCPFPGRQFSPALSVPDLTAAGGRLRPLLRAASEDAEYDLCFATNDPPATPCPRLAFLLPGALPALQARTVVEVFSTWRAASDNTSALLLVSDQTARTMTNTASEGDSPPLPPGVIATGSADQAWLRRACHEVTHGAHAVADITHLATLDPAQALTPEILARTAALALYLREDALLHSPATPPPSWPESLIDLRQFLRHGLPRSSFHGYLTRLERGGLVRHCPAGTPPALPPLGRLAQIRQRLAAPRPANPDAALTRLRLLTATQLRQRDHDAVVERDRLQRRLEAAGLWEPDQARADLDRSNRTLLSLLRNRHQGQRAVVVGNGPSLRIHDLERLGDAVTFASNKIYLAYPETAWRPHYYSVEDHLILLNNRDRIEALDGSLKIFPANTRDFGYHAADTVFVPFLPPASFEDPCADPDFPAFSRDLSLGIAWGSTIVYSQIQMALYMGCREIVLIGVDHRYTLPGRKQGNQYLHDGEQNHFHPDYRQPGETWHEPNLKVLEVSYAKARDTCAAAGVRLLNASRDSALGVLERVEFDRLFPQTGVSHDRHAADL